MPDTDTVALFINEASSQGGVGDLESYIAGQAGVLSVALDRSEQHGMGPQPSIVQRATIQYDAASTNPQALRTALEERGYAVTAIGAVSE